MDFDLYHDESKKDGYWHGVLLVPKPSRRRLLSLLAEVRQNAKYAHALTFKRVKRKGGGMFNAAQCWVMLGLAGMRGVKKGDAIPVWLGARGGATKRYVKIDDALGLKFILFRVRDDLTSMSGHRDYGSKVETTARFAVKGGLHMLGSDQRPIHVSSLHFDGHEHHGREFNRDRLVGRLQGLRRYCSVSDADDCIFDGSGNHAREGHQPYDDCQLLQLTDLLVGAFRISAQGCGDAKAAQKRISEPAKRLVGEYHKGAARMRNSRWANSFCMSECYLENEIWSFGTIEYEADDTCRQEALQLD